MARWLLGSVAVVGLAAGAMAAKAEVSRARDLRCATFPASLDAQLDIDTRDASTDLGRWVAARRAEGADVDGIDFEVGTKPTGYPVGFVHVCMRYGPSAD